LEDKYKKIICDMDVLNDLLSTAADTFKKYSIFEADEIEILEKLKNRARGARMLAYSLYAESIWLNAQHLNEETEESV
jgi:hypothetical protein